MNLDELERILEAILFASGDPVETARLSSVTGASEDDVCTALETLQNRLAFERRGIRILRLEDAWQMCSDKEQISYVTLALETRKPPRLSPAQLETLTIVAYYQPATKTLVEQLRGVDSSYSISALLNKKLIAESGRLNVPGRPIQYVTTPDFLRCFSLSSLSELPEISVVDRNGGRVTPDYGSLIPEGQLSMDSLIEERPEVEQA